MAKRRITKATIEQCASEIASYINDRFDQDGTCRDFTYDFYDEATDLVLEIGVRYETEIINDPGTKWASPSQILENEQTIILWVKDEDGNYRSDIAERLDGCDKTLYAAQRKQHQT